MISEEKIAVQVSDRVLEASRLLNEALFLVKGSCPEAEFLVCRTAIGQVLGELLLSVLNPIYRSHPQIMPEDLKDF